MRGKLGQCGRSVADAGITPADAGKTAAAVKKLALCQDHPRGCGENSTITLSCRKSIGSPPRMRGKLADERDFDVIFRITPADAGKTLSVRLTPSAFQDHPRGCGENKH